MQQGLPEHKRVPVSYGRVGQTTSKERRLAGLNYLRCAVALHSRSAKSQLSSGLPSRALFNPNLAAPIQGHKRSASPPVPWCCGEEMAQPGLNTAS